MVHSLANTLLVLLRTGNTNGVPANVERLKWLLIDRNGVSLVLSREKDETKAWVVEVWLVRSVDKTRLWHHARVSQVTWPLTSANQTPPHLRLSPDSWLGGAQRQGLWAVVGMCWPLTVVPDLGPRNVHRSWLLEHALRVHSWVYIGLRANMIVTPFLPV